MLELEKFQNYISNINIETTYPRFVGTKQLTDAICDYCIDRNIKYKKEVTFRIDELNLKKTKMIIDIIIDNKIAIEIDSSNKIWSLEKLTILKTFGFIPVWVRWCAPVTIDIPKDIILIENTK